MENKNITKISAAEIKKMVSESYNKQIKKAQLEEQLVKIQSKINALNEEQTIGVPGAVGPANPTQAAPPEPEKTESIFDAAPGNIIIFNFQDVTIKLQKQLNDLFKVVDAVESKKLKEGDYVVIKGNDTLQKGKEFKMEILRPSLSYMSNPLISWKIIKNK